MLIKHSRRLLGLVIYFSLIAFLKTIFILLVISILIAGIWMSRSVIPIGDLNRVRLEDLVTLISWEKILASSAIFFASTFISDIAFKSVEKVMNTFAVFPLKRLLKPEGVYINLKTQRNTVTTHINGLDDIVRDLYESADGDIFLFNPDEDVFNINSDKMKDLQDVIIQKMKIGRIRELKIRGSKALSFIIEEFKQNNPTIGDKIAFTEVKVTQLNRRYAIYRILKNGSEYHVDYFLYRPMREPYFDKYVIIKERSVLGRLRDSDQPLSSRVTALMTT